MWAALIMLALAIALAGGCYAWVHRQRPPPRPRSGPSLRLVWKSLLLAAPIRLWALILAGPALCALELALILILWRGGWQVEHQALQLKLLGGLAIFQAASVMVIVVSLAAVKVEAETKLGRLAIGAEREDD